MESIQHTNRYKCEVTDACKQLFSGLDDARFDQVRRAVAADPTCLQARARHSTNGQTPLAPIAYALANCRTWRGLAAHCQRTGMAIAHGGDLTFRERLSAMNVILPWLLLQRGCETVPTDLPLHTALMCGLDVFAHKLIMLAPDSARCVDSRSKSALHVVCSMHASRDVQDTIDYVNLLAANGVDVCGRDAEGATPMHNLLQSVVGVGSSYGLCRRRRSGFSNLDCNLDGVLPIIDSLLLHGGDLTVRDRRGLTVLDTALQHGLSYLRLIQRAVLLRDKLCNLDSDGKQQRCSSVGLVAGAGMWANLPEDVVVKVMSMLSPYDVMFGIGATCHAMRRLASSKCLWTHLEMSNCMQHLRQSVSRNLSQHLAVMATPMRNADGAVGQRT